MTHEQPLANPAPNATPAFDLTALFAAEHLTDQHLLGALMDPGRESAADSLLREAGSLAGVHAQGPLELLALGCTPAEAARLNLLGEYIARIQRHQPRELGTLEAFARDVVRRATAERWMRECVGIACVDAHSRVLQDRILFVGTSQEVFVGIPEILRECLRSGGDGLVIYRWHPAPDITFTSGDLSIAEEIRVAAAVLRIRLVDYLVVNPQTCLSARIGQGWIE